MSDDDEWSRGDVTSMIANPFYAITIDEGLAVPHEPLISEDNWVEANVRLIDELGAEPLSSSPPIRQGSSRSASRPLSKDSTRR